MSFKSKKYKIIKNAISPEIYTFLTGYILLKKHTFKTFSETKYISPFNRDYGSWQDGLVDTYSCYGDFASETLLQILRPRFEKETKLKLYPTYAYHRVYKKGSILRKHSDRPECEISGTIFIGGDKWPIYVESNKVSKINLDYGDMLIYKGEEVMHWRDPFEGNTCIQIFVHYSTNKDLLFDSRPHLGLPGYFKNDK